jgi:hypothetical protein
MYFCSCSTRIVSKKLKYRKRSPPKKTHLYGLLHLLLCIENSPYSAVAYFRNILCLCMCVWLITFSCVALEMFHLYATSIFVKFVVIRILKHIWTLLHAKYLQWSRMSWCTWLMKQSDDFVHFCVNNLFLQGNRNLEGNWSRE